MVQESRELAGRIEAETPQFKTGAKLLADFAISLSREGLLPDRLPKQPKSTPSEELAQAPELDLNAEWQRQANRYIELGYHTELGMDAQQYLDSLPGFTSQPEAFRGRFDTPLLVETRIGIDRQLEVAGLTNWLKGAGLDTRNWPDDPKGYKTPEAPYSTWANDPAKNRNRKVEDVRKILKEDERGGTSFDGIAAYIANPNKLNEVYIDLPGDSVGSAYAPYLHLFRGRPDLHYGWVGSADPKWGSLVCGREIEN